MSATKDFQPLVCGYCVRFQCNPSLQLIECGHQFAIGCYTRWLNLNHDVKCPVCMYGQPSFQCGKCSIRIQNASESYTLNCKCMFHHDCIKRHISEVEETCPVCEIDVLLSDTDDLELDMDELDELKKSVTKEKEIVDTVDLDMDDFDRLSQSIAKKKQTVLNNPAGNKQTDGLATISEKMDFPKRSKLLELLEREPMNTMKKADNLDSPKQKLEREPMNTMKKADNLDSPKQKLERELLKARKKAEKIDSTRRKLEKELLDTMKKADDLDSPRQKLEKEPLDTMKKTDGLDSPRQKLEKEPLDTMKKTDGLDSQSQKLEREPLDRMKKANDLDSQSQKLEMEPLNVMKKAEKIDSPGRKLEKELLDVRKKDEMIDSPKRKLEKEPVDAMKNFDTMIKKVKREPLSTLMKQEKNT